MATGRLEKFFKENTLTEQAFVKNPDQTVADYTAEVAKSLGRLHQDRRLQALRSGRIRFRRLTAAGSS